LCEAIPALPQYICKVWCLIKHRDNLIFYFESGGYADNANSFAEHIRVTPQITKFQHDEVYIYFGYLTQETFAIYINYTINELKSRPRVLKQLTVWHV
jgi:hypothetical protein